MSLSVAVPKESAPLSLFHLLDPEVLANPYPLYRRLREEDPVHWDPYLHAWVVTRYEDVVTVLHRYKAARTPGPERLVGLGLGELSPIGALMVRQMLFLDAPDHRRVRKLASVAFTPRRVAALRDHIRHITDGLVAELAKQPGFDVMTGLAEPLPAIVTAELLGVPVSDHEMLKAWSQDFAEMLGNFQHNPGQARRMLRSVDEMLAYFHAAVARESVAPTEGLINALVTAAGSAGGLTIYDNAEGEDSGTVLAYIPEGLTVGEQITIQMPASQGITVVNVNDGPGVTIGFS